MRMLLLAGLALALLPPLAPAADAAETAASSTLAAVVRAIEAGELEAAEAELRRRLAGGEDPVARDLLGVVLGRQGRVAEAERELARALELDPELLPARQHLARLYLLQERQEAALRELRVAAGLGPLERDLALRLAAAEAAAGDGAAAERQLRSVAERFGSVQALLSLARLSSRRGDPRGALELLRRAREIAPSSEEVLRRIAHAALAVRDPVNAILALVPLTRMHPTVAEYAYLMGIARLQVGDTASAVEALETARELEPRRASTLVGLGLALNAQKRYPEAKEALAEGLRLEPDNADVLAALAEAEHGLDELAAAEEHALRALAAAPEQATANIVLGMLRLKEGRHEEARAALERAVAADPGSPKAHYQLSLAYARLGDDAGSRKHRELYQRALDAYEESLRELAPGSGA